jgi:hypothetical protein
VRPAIPILLSPRTFFLSSQTWRRWCFFIFPLLGYAILIFYGSSQSRWLFEPPDFFSSDKFYHFLEYMIFGVLSGRIIAEDGFPHTLKNKMVLVLMISFLYGLSDEFHQWFIPGRSATLGDVLADTLGGGSGGLLLFKFKRKGLRIN